MGLFDKLKSTSNEDIALQLFNSQNLGETVNTQAQKIIDSCSNRQEILLKAIELCGNDPTTPKQLYIVSHCYVWLGAKYRKQAIEYLEKYIAVGAAWDGTPQDTIDMGNYQIDQLKANKASVYNYLGKAYEGEYQFDKAEQAYLNAEKLDPSFATFSVCVANTYIKRNELEKALEYLNSKKQTSYYKQDTQDYRVLLENAINDVTSKIEKGYQYKPRKRQN